MSKNSYAHLLSSVQAAALESAKEVKGGINADRAEDEKEPANDKEDGKAKKAKAKSKKMDSEKDDEDEGEEDEKRNDKKDEEEDDDMDKDDNKSKKAKKDSASSSDLGAQMEAARLEERVRCARIFRSDAAAGRIETACQFAFHTDLSADAAIAIMETIPVAAPAQATRRVSIDERMAKAPSANVGSDVVKTDSVEEEGISEAAFAKLSSEQKALMIVNAGRSLNGEAPLTKLN